MRGSDIRNRLRITFIAVALAFTIGTLVQFAGAVFWAKSASIEKYMPGRPFFKEEVAGFLGRKLITGEPLQAPETVRVKDQNLSIHYSVDPRLQQTVEQALKHGGVPYGAFVAIDPKTGQVLAMASHGKRGENLNLRATFPAASIFKIITAAAAIEKTKLKPNSLIPVRGSYHTLYKQNIFHGGGIDPASSPRYARLISLGDALAKSVNSVFGKIGIFGVGPVGLRNIASRFQFGNVIPFEMPMDVSQAPIPDDEFGLAESASGFNRRTTLSPLHGALIAAAIANDGVMMQPSIVSKITDDDQDVRYSFEPKALASTIDSITADQLSTMMNQTIVNGTSRRAFRGISRSPVLSDLFIGGKTGTLNGLDPVGRYDWFVGFAENANTKLAVAALCIHGSRHGVKASQIARTAFEAYFKPVVASTTQDEKPRSSRGKRNI